MNKTDSMFAVSITSLRLALVVFLVFGLLYSLAGVGIGKVLAPSKANGSLIIQNNRIQGSELVGQNFSDTRYFIGRPSAAQNNPMAVAGSNMARSNPELKSQIASREAELRTRFGLESGQLIPSDLLTASGSGIDPHISPQAALIQVEAVAKARGVLDNQVLQMVQRNVEQPLLGVFGQAHVNVLKLNLALDSMDRS